MRGYSLLHILTLSWLSASFRGVNFNLFWITAVQRYEMNKKRVYGCICHQPTTKVMLQLRFGWDQIADSRDISVWPCWWKSNNDSQRTTTDCHLISTSDSGELREKKKDERMWLLRLSYLFNSRTERLSCAGLVYASVVYWISLESTALSRIPYCTYQRFGSLDGFQWLITYLVTRNSCS